MFELLTLALFVCLLVKAVKLAFRLTWCMTKGIASILMAAAVPLLVVCLVFVGGVALIIPVAVIGIAVGILKACV